MLKLTVFSSMDLMFCTKWDGARQSGTVRNPLLAAAFYSATLLLCYSATTASYYEYDYTSI